MCVCLYSYIYTCIYICKYVYTYTPTHSHTHTLTGFHVSGTRELRDSEEVVKLRAEYAKELEGKKVMVSSDQIHLYADTHI